MSRLYMRAGAAFMVLVAGAWVVACGKSDPSPCAGVSGCVEAEGHAGGPLVSCVVGAWTPLGNGGQCAPIPCRPDGGPPECLQADCTKTGYTLFVPDSAPGNSGRMFTGSFVSSEVAGTWSATLPPEIFAYAVDGSTLETDGGSGPRSQEMTCTAEQLVFGQLSANTRLSVADAEALRALVTDGGTWVGASRP